MCGGSCGGGGGGGCTSPVFSSGIGTSFLCRLRSGSLISRDGGSSDIEKKKTSSVTREMSLSDEPHPQPLSCPSTCLPEIFKKHPFSRQASGASGRRGRGMRSQAPRIFSNRSFSTSLPITTKRSLDGSSSLLAKSSTWSLVTFSTSSMYCGMSRTNGYRSCCLP